MNGWAGKILRVDLSKKTSSTENTSPYTSFLGGRGINVKILYDEVGLDVSPLDPENRLIFGPGVLTGTSVPTASRTMVTTLCPSEVIGSSGFGGYMGAEIRQAGYDNVIIQGKSDEPVYLYIHDETVEIRDAGKVWGKETLEAERLIKNEIGDPDVVVLCIGPAGENLVSFACIRTGMQSAAGRDGSGTIMGSKKLKAIAVRGKRDINLADPQQFLKASYESHRMILGHPKLRQPWSKVSLGAIELNKSANDRGLSTFGNFENVDWDEIDAKNYVRGGFEYYNKHFTARVGCSGCPVYRCYRICDDPETGLGVAKCYAQPMFTFRVWNREWSIMQTASHLCNNYGLDVQSTANIISFLMELHHRGIITEKDTDGIAMVRGDKNAIISMIHKVATQQGFGKVLRDGVLNAARKIGSGAEDCAMQIKGLEMGLNDLRGRKGTALAAAVLTKKGGGEYPRGESAWSSTNNIPGTAYPGSYENKALMVYESTNYCKVLDSLGICKNFAAWMTSTYMDKSAKPLDIPAKLFSLATGVKITSDDLLLAANKMHTLERAFDVMRGKGRKDDTLPPRMFQNTVPGGPLKGETLDKSKFEKMLDEYYQLSGWDENGIPKEATFKKLNLIHEWEIFEKRLKTEVANA